jgi:hypothetical protein
MKIAKFSVLKRVRNKFIKSISCSERFLSSNQPGLHKRARVQSFREFLLEIKSPLAYEVNSHEVGPWKLIRP